MEPQEYLPLVCPSHRGKGLYEQHAGAIPQFLDDLRMRSQPVVSATKGSECP